MRVYTAAHIAATEKPVFYDRPDVDTTVFAPDDSLVDTIHIDGTPAERGAFLRALAAAALAVADEIDRVGVSA